MPRSTNSKVTRARHHKILKLAKGYFGSKHTLYRTAHEQVMRSLRYQFRDRKQRKRNFRKLWITRINAACRLNGISYSLFITGLKREKIELNRKVLAELAVSDPNAFKDLVAVAKKGVKKQLPAEFGQLEKELPAYLNPQDFGTAKNAKASQKAEAKPAAEKKAAPAKATATKTVAEKKETVKKEAPAKQLLLQNLSLKRNLLLLKPQLLKLQLNQPLKRNLLLLNLPQLKKQLLLQNLLVRKNQLLKK